MNSIIPLGKFQRVEPITKAWPNEAGNFTPWLAQKDIITQLGDTLDMEIEVEAVEHWVGSFRLDILGRVADEPEHRVVIENQFGSTDHKHLGQLLTYLAGIEGAKTVIWIAEKIQADHRAAVDWLNNNTVADFSFFALEIELWKIDNSPPAPRFNVIASPNDWTRSAKAVGQEVPSGELAERYKIRLAYWSSFADYVKLKESNFRVRRTNKDAWCWFAIGRAGFGIEAYISFEKERIGVALYMSNDPTKAAIRALIHEKDAIENEFGEPLEWQELIGKKASRVVVYKYDVDPADETQYQDLHSWMLTRMEAFRKVFANRVKALVLTTTVIIPDEDDMPGDV